MVSTKCPHCDAHMWAGVEYRNTSEDYDGISEWVCQMCHTRYGRWTGKELQKGELEKRYGRHSD